jgi:NAD(P)H dehydrogenase (quinone)
MTFLISGATGQLGRLVVESLLRRGVPAGEIVAAGRDLTKVADLAERGVQTRSIDFDDLAGLSAAFEGVHRALLVSGNEIGSRIAQHRNFIDAAKAAGVELLGYTSLANAGTSNNLLATDHKGTEEALHESGVPAVVLRNSFYIEVYTGQLPSYLERGAILGSAGDGKISAATRADFAEAAAEVLTTEGHVGQVYELGGPAFGFAELAAAITDETGTTVVYRDVSPVEHADLLTGAGLPADTVHFILNLDEAIRNGELVVPTDDLEKLLGRPATPYRTALAIPAAAH